MTQLELETKQLYSLSDIKLMIGTSINPIDIDAPEEEIQDIEAIKERNRNRQLIEEAKLSKCKVALALAVIKTKIKGDLKVKNMTLNRAIIDFLQPKIGINISFEHFCPRLSPQYSEQNPPNPLQFLLYGVDFLQTCQIRDRFEVNEPNINQIIWINSSTCKLVYKTKEQARKALELVVADPKYLKGKMDQEDNQEGMPLGWFSLRNYPLYQFERQLLIRYATQKEKDLQKESMEKYQQFQKLACELIPHLFQKFQALDTYKAVVIQIQRQRNTVRRHTNNYPRDRRQFRSRTRERNPRDGRTPRNYDNRPSQYNSNTPYRSYEPESMRMREIRKVHYEHQPSDMRHRRMRNQQMRAPKHGDTYFDCNDIDYDPSNLSFQIPENGGIQPNSDDSSLNNEIIDGNLSFNIPVSQLGNNNRSRQNQDLSFVFDNSRHDKNQNNSQINELNVSLICQPQLNQSEHQNQIDTSICFMNREQVELPQNQLDLSLAQFDNRGNEKELRKQEEQEEISILLGINNQLSPIQQAGINILDTSIQMAEIKPQRKKESKNEKKKGEYLDYQKPQKKSNDKDWNKQKPIENPFEEPISY